MRVFVVTYELNQKNKDYSGFYNELKKTNAWWHYLEHTWLLYTNETAQEIFDRLIPFIDNKDHILIVEAGRNRQGWLPKKAWPWIEKVL
ncbi:unnamed protein product [marine sediment metagenome]|uniref:SinR family protein n=1 Tax=marine sediment metagenome TaxID=412755 RepID=X1KAE8_9ZZZZ